MHLKPFLRKTLNERSGVYKSKIELTEESLRVLEQTGTSKANYIVYLESWTYEGESTITEHKGTLKDAIKRAEAEFKTTNNRSDIQANYSVDILLGDGRYLIPKSYWQKFQRNSPE